MQRFWLTAAELPAGNGFVLFGPAHLVWLIASIAAIVFLCRFCRGHAVLTSRILAVVLAASELWKDLFLAAKGQFWAGNLPLYLCGFALFWILADAFFPRTLFLGILYGLNLPGTIGALLFPDWQHQPPFGFLSAQGFFFHALVAAYIIFQLACGRRPHVVHGFIACLIFLAVYAPAIKLLDGWLGTNFVFLEYPPPGSPLEWIFNTFGPLYIPLYAAFGVFLVTVMYTPLWLLAARHKKA